MIGGYAATAVAVLVSVNIAYGGLIVSVKDLFADLNPPMNYHHTGHMHTHHRATAPGPSTSASPGTSATPTASSSPNSAGVSGLAG